jgi:hypothetical protein
MSINLSGWGSTIKCRPAYNAVLGHFFENESATEPVSLDEAKDWLKITFDDADDELTGLISEVRQIFEEVLGVIAYHKGRRGGTTIRDRFKNGASVRACG